jgi:hypothetical protein
MSLLGGKMEGGSRGSHEEICRKEPCPTPDRHKAPTTPHHRPLSLHFSAPPFM